MTSQPGQQTMTIHILPNISRSKENQTLEIGQVGEYNKRNIFLQTHAKIEAGRLVPNFFLLFKKALHEVKASSMQLSFNHFRQSSTQQTIKTKYIKLQNVDPEICSILVFQKTVWEKFLNLILCMIFQEKCFSSCILVTDQFSLPGYLYFLRYQSLFVQQLFVNQAVTSQILRFIIFLQLNRFPT